MKREVVAAMVARGVAERRACRAVSMPRSTNRYQAVRRHECRAADQQLRERLGLRSRETRIQDYTMRVISESPE